MMITTRLELVQQMGTNHKEMGTYNKENIVGLFQTSTSIAINEVQALSSRQETKKVWNKH
jgi:hypothetical protein